ncbi:MAG: hypothetical protein SV375_02670 [Thermodesulfobacteriota bacterium]|nr:hypothetical protein [Thermodesulfobacteriota bacterium]
MKNETDRLISSGEEYMNKRRFTDAAKCYEMVATVVEDKEKIVEFFLKAAQAYGQWGDTENTVRCYRKASQFLTKSEKAECLLDCWKAYIFAIASCEWECCFEWRGDDGHDDDHDIYQGLIKQLQNGAEKVLKEAVNIEGADRRKIIKLAKKECRRRKRKDGWGSVRCLNIITNVTQGS